MSAMRGPGSSATSFLYQGANPFDGLRQTFGILYLGLSLKLEELASTTSVGINFRALLIDTSAMSASFISRQKMTSGVDVCLVLGISYGAII